MANLWELFAPDPMYPLAISCCCWLRFLQTLRSVSKESMNAFSLLLSLPHIMECVAIVLLPLLLVLCFSIIIEHTAIAIAPVIDPVFVND